MRCVWGHADLSRRSRIAFGTRRPHQSSDVAYPRRIVMNPAGAAHFANIFYCAFIFAVLSQVRTPRRGVIILSNEKCLNDRCFYDRFVGCNRAICLRLDGRILNRLLLCLQRGILSANVILFTSIFSSGADVVYNRGKSRARSRICADCDASSPLGVGFPREERSSVERPRRPLNVEEVKDHSFA